MTAMRQASQGCRWCSRRLHLMPYLLASLSARTWCSERQHWPTRCCHGE